MFCYYGSESGRKEQHGNLQIGSYFQVLVHMEVELQKSH